MRLLSASLVMFALLPSTFSAPATTVTLYNVQITPDSSRPTPHATFKYSDTVSPVGVGSDGMTTYREIVTVFGKILVEFSSTFILTDSQFQTTITHDFAADASGYADANTITNRFGQNETITLSYTCKFEGTTAGFCVDHNAEQIGGGPIEIKTTTYSGPLSAYYTVTETAAIPGQTQSSRGVGGRVWKTVDLLSGLTCLLAIHKIVAFLEW